MPWSEIPILATLALAAGPWWFARAFRDFRTRRLIENTPTARIRSMAMGLVEIATRGRRNSWTTVHRAASGSPFFVRDETGLALIFPKDADCRVVHQVEEVCTGINLPDCYAQYMADQHLMFRHVWRLSTLRFRERMLEEGQRVYVLGTAMPRPQVMEVSQEAEVAATGTDGPHERRIRQLQQEAAGIVRRGDNERVFIISQQSERELTLTLSLRAWGQLIGGPVVTLLGLGYWLQVLASRGRFPG